ncbi:hypothetical protein HYX07_05165 [Candidatus Woesearchaeota archaeon]|nr:hypothetical protein [Candidatus Woesearchaeota archaeon]
MSFKNFLISITKSLIVLVIATFIFSTVTLDFPDLIKGVFGDIFSYASPEAQKQVVSQLAESCSSLEQGGAVTISQVCGNASLLGSMKENCADYRELQKRNVRVENEQQVKETCSQIESGEIERQCSEMQKSMLPDFSKIGALCKDYRSGKINDKEFFYNVLGNSLPSNAMDFGFLDRYNKAMGYLNSNKIVYFIVFFILLVALYLLIADIKLFFFALIEISFGIGLIIMLPYFVIIAYQKFVGFDTSSILGSMLGFGSFEPRAILSLILLMFLRTYTPFIIAAGIVFLSVGIAGKIYSFMQKGKGKVEEKPEIKAKKKKSKTAKKL